jgi:periplasmic copper chaperone A
MKKILCLLLATGFIFSSEAFAVIRITNAWVPVTQKGGDAIVSMTIQNDSNSDDTLKSVQTTASQGIMLQGRSPNGTITNVNYIQIYPNSSINFTPATYHILLKNLKSPLVVGSSVTVNLNFDKAKTVALPVAITTGGPLKTH